MISWDGRNDNMAVSLVIKKYSLCAVGSALTTPMSSLAVFFFLQF